MIIIKKSNSTPTLQGWDIADAGGLSLRQFCIDFQYSDILQIFDLKWPWISDYSEFSSWSLELFFSFFWVIFEH